MSDLPASFYRAEESWLNPPDERDPPRVQIEGSLFFGTLQDMESIDTGDLEDIKITDAGFDPATGLMRVDISGWLDSDKYGDYDSDKIGELQDAEVVDTENVDFGPEDSV